MLEVVTATRFDRRMTNGKTKPCLMACDCADGAEVEVVVKLSGGCERGIGGLVTEALVAMFAADLELPVPEPYVVRVESELVQIIPDAEIRDLYARSSNVAFGSSTSFHQNVDKMKTMDSLARLGANHSDTSWYREDLQRRMASEDAISCQCFGGTKY